MPDATARVALDARPPSSFRWIVNVATWRPADAGLNSSSPCSRPERDAVRRFRRFDDRKRAVVSRLMQRACIMRACETSSEGRWSARGSILSTCAGPRGPAVSRRATRVDARAEFNYNVSHEGDYVVLASETHAVVGVDVAAPGRVRAVATGRGRGRQQRRAAVGGVLVGVDGSRASGDRRRRDGTVRGQGKSC